MRGLLYTHHANSKLCQLMLDCVTAGTKLM